MPESQAQINALMVHQMELSNTLLSNTLQPSSPVCSLHSGHSHESCKERWEHVPSTIPLHFIQSLLELSLALMLKGLYLRG